MSRNNSSRSPIVSFKQCIPVPTANGDIQHGSMVRKALGVEWEGGGGALSPSSIGTTLEDTAPTHGPGSDCMSARPVIVANRTVSTGVQARTSQVQVQYVLRGSPYDSREEDTSTSVEDFITRGKIYISGFHNIDRKKVKQ